MYLLLEEPCIEYGAFFVSYIFCLAIENIEYQITQ